MAKLVALAVAAFILGLGIAWWLGWLGRAPIVETPVRLQTDLRSRITYARGEGPILLIVAGRPFAVDAQATADAVLETVQGVPQGQGLSYTLDPEAAGAPAFALRAVFNPPVDANGARLCAGSVTGGRPDAPGVRVMVGFCEGERTLIYTKGRLGEAEGLDDPRVIDLLRVAVREVMKRR